MTSQASAPKLQVDSPRDKTTAPVSVRFPDARLKKLIRKAAAEVDQSRSEFIAEAATFRMRVVLKLQRDEDFRRALEEAA